MGPTEISGLPAHVLIVHLVVVMIPAAALCVVLSAWWPGARRWLGWLTPIAGLAAVVISFFAAQAGEWLEERVGETPLIEKHTDLGELMTWWAFGLFIAAVVLWLWHRRSGAAGGSATGRGRAVAGVVIGVIATAVAIGSVVHVIRVGESGSRAVWEGSYTSSPQR